MTTIDIANLSMALSHSQVKDQASILIMKKMMGNVQQQGAAIQELLSSSNVQAIQHAAQPHLGGTIDLKL
ncbi:YjfB family protein [Lederbergia graminis]|uniref:YjfB family protein n=1 Tax=Lederbergia graminis TaxID=735518 RepID=A0ABW0LLW8_9BACI|nr:YjfB family protein [Paenibacillus bovis]